jgi:hypothetical protein
VLETMVAATVVLLVLLTLLGALSFGLQGTRNAEGHQKAVAFARQMMELIRERGLARIPVSPPPAIGFDDPAGARIELDAPPFQPKPPASDPSSPPVEDFPAASGYTRRLVTRRLSLDPDDYQSRLYRIEITLFWRVKARENSCRLVGYDRAP